MAICSYWMNEQWLSEQMIQASGIKYCEAGHSHELPSDYFIRKKTLVELLYDYDDRTMISEIMRGAPEGWVKIVDPMHCDTLLDLQNAIKYNESALMTPTSESNDLEHRL